MSVHHIICISKTNTSNTSNDRAYRKGEVTMLLDGVPQRRLAWVTLAREWSDRVLLEEKLGRRVSIVTRWSECKHDFKLFHSVPLSTPRRRVQPVLCAASCACNMWNRGMDQGMSLLISLFIVVFHFFPEQKQVITLIPSPTLLFFRHCALIFRSCFLFLW